MENFTSEKLPQAIILAYEKLNQVERLLQEKQPQQETEELFGIFQADKSLNLKELTLYTKVGQNEIPVNKKGNRLYFYKSELMQWNRKVRKKTVSKFLQDALSYNKSKRKSSPL